MPGVVIIGLGKIHHLLAFVGDRNSGKCHIHLPAGDGTQHSLPIVRGDFQGVSPRLAVPLKEIQIRPLNHSSLTEKHRRRGRRYGHLYDFSDWTAGATRENQDQQTKVGEKSKGISHILFPIGNERGKRTLPRRGLVSNAKLPARPQQSALPLADAPPKDSDDTESACPSH